MNCVINFVKNRIEYEDTFKEMKAQDRGVLEHLARNQGIFLSLSQIFDTVWGYDSEVKDDEAAVRQAIRSIRTEFPFLAEYLTTKRKIGYKLELPKGYRVIFSGDSDAVRAAASSGSQSAEPVALPKVLTRTNVFHADETTAIHRGSDLEKLKLLLSKKKAAVMISGFGGLGKTTVARMLYAELAGELDSVGWVEYHGNLKDSLMASLSLYQEIHDGDQRWNALYECLKNDQTKKLLFIDNVDSDKAHGQDPQKDVLLSEISGWPNLSVVLTSRFDQLRGYRSYRLGMLDPEACADLFYYYYNEWEYEIPMEERNQRDAVRSLVDLAGYHTYAVELLAKSARYTPSLEEYLTEVKKVGFRFPKLNVQTDHRNAYANAAEQLKKLFDLSTRNDEEMQILWDFSVLPNLELTMNEVEQWLGYTVNDLDQLIREGWLLFRQGCLMHPLIKETMHLELVKGKAPEGTMNFFLSKIVCGEFLMEEEIDSFVEAKRKLDVAEHVLRLVPIPKEEGMEEMQSCLEFWLASCYNSLGYFLSYTNTGRNEAMGYLRKSLKMRRQLEACYPGNGRNRSDLATSCDYLGYLLSDQVYEKAEAEALLLEALAIRTELERKEPGLHLKDVAWTLDNLGYLLSSVEGRQEEAELRLKEALKIRQSLEQKEPGEYAGEVGWTCNNLGQLLQCEEERFAEAEAYYRLALEHCGQWIGCNYTWEAADSAILYNNLATLLQHHSDRNTEAEELYREALDIMKSVKNVRKEMYLVELLISCHNLVVFLSRKPEAKDEVSALKMELVKLAEELEQIYPGIYDEQIQELLSDESSFFIQSGSRKQKVPAAVCERVRIS